MKLVSRPPPVCVKQTIEFSTQIITPLRFNHRRSAAVFLGSWLRSPKALQPAIRLDWGIVSLYDWAVGGGDDVAKYLITLPLFCGMTLKSFSTACPTIGEIATCRRLAPSYSPLYTPLFVLTNAIAFSWVKDFCPC